MKNIEISDDIYLKLSSLGGALFSPAEVIERLLKMSTKSEATTRTISLPIERGQKVERYVRNPRERGISVMLDDVRVDAVSVRDLFEKVLKWLVDGGQIGQIEKSLPLRTSKQRYLISKSPVHPAGNEFVVPVRYKGYSMEAHKNYENALSGLNQLARIGGFSIRVIG